MNWLLQWEFFFKQRPRYSSLIRRGKLWILSGATQGSLEINRPFIATGVLEKFTTHCVPLVPDKKASHHTVLYHSTVGQIRKASRRLYPKGGTLRKITTPASTTSEE